MNYNTMKFEDILAWCQENNQIAWLQKKLDEKVECKVYPRKKITNEKGKKVAVADKSQEPYTVTRDVPFMKVKYDFCEKFMPEIMPESAKPKKPSMKDILAAALAK